MNDMKIAEPMKVFIDAVVAPFSATRPAQIPDGYNHHTICLQDWIDQLAIGVDAPNLANIGGMAFYLMVGQNIFTSKIVSSSDKPTYVIVVMPIDANGVIQTNNAVTGLSTLYFTNYQFINGSATSINIDNALVDSFRLFACGMRLWPTIEVITSSDTLAVSNYYAGLITPSSMFKCVDEANNFYNVLRQSEYIEEFQNSQGASVRLDPFSYPDYLTMRTLSNWQSIDNFDTSLMEFPIIVARFTKTVVDGDIAPIKFMAQAFLEGQLVQPTPLFTAQAPYDLEYGLITKLVANNPDTYPIVSKGHTFKSFLKGVNKVSGLVRKAANVSSGLLPAKYSNYAKQVANVAATAQSLTGKNKAKKKAAKKKVKRAALQYVRKAVKQGAQADLLQQAANE